MPFAIRIGGTNEFVSFINPNDTRCVPPGSINTVQGWENDETLIFFDEDEAKASAELAERIDGCPCSVEPVKLTEGQFRRMVQAHDLTYSYSDDHSYWVRGQASINRIRAAKEHVDPEVAVQIWNECVDSKIAEQAREQFYWSVPEPS